MNIPNETTERKYKITYPDFTTERVSLLELVIMSWDKTIVTVDDGAMGEFIMLNDSDFDYVRDPGDDDNAYPSVHDATEIQEPFTPVVFRIWKIDGNMHLIALFPSIPSDYEGKYCESFMHIGQHSGADYKHIMEETRRAMPEEYASLKRELESYPYNYRLVVRDNGQTPEDRREFLRELGRYRKANG